MKALFPSRRALGLVACVLLGLGLAACDFNVEITDEKRSLEKIGGTSPCPAGQRYSEGKSGVHTLRIFMVDDRQNPEALDLDGIEKEPFNLKIGSFEVASDFTPKIITAEDGTPVSGGSATITLVTDGDEPLLVQPNPRYSALKNSIGNKRVPKAVNLLVDMSETSADQDSSLSRTSAPAGWVLENFNADSTQGDLDIFSAFLVRSGEVSSTDVQFKTWDEDLQFIASDGRRRGFILTTEDAKEQISSHFTNISNSKVNGQPPAYAAIQAGASDTRAVARDADTKEPLFNPGLILVSLERDHHLLDDTRDNALQNAITASKGGAWDADADADFIPVMSVVYPPPEKTDIKQWDAYLDGLCQIAQAAGASKRFYWGQVFQVPTDARRSYQAKVRNHLDMAYHALKGYIELKVNYSLSGSLESGKRYFVSFKLQAELLQQKSKVDDSPEITFEVRIK